MDRHTQIMLLRKKLMKPFILNAICRTKLDKYSLVILMLEIYVLTAIIIKNYSLNYRWFI